MPIKRQGLLAVRNCSKDMTISVQKYVKNYVVRSYEADCHGFLRLLSLMNILQDIACENADALGFGFAACAERNLAWVGSNYLLKIKRLPKIDEHFSIETWPSGTKLWGGLRDFNIKSSTGEIIVSAVSQWVLIDVERRRPVILSKYFPAYSILPERALESDFTKFDTVEDPDSVHAFVVRFDDIDVNNHANNAIYPLWASESVDGDFRLNHVPQELEICFRKEALYGERVEVRTKQNESESLHTICDKKSGAVLADCRIVWREITSE